MDATMVVDKLSSLDHRSVRPTLPVAGEMFTSTMRFCV